MWARHGSRRRRGLGVIAWVEGDAFVSGHVAVDGNARILDNGKLRGHGSGVLEWSDG